MAASLHLYTLNITPSTFFRIPIKHQSQTETTDDICDSQDERDVMWVAFKVTNNVSTVDSIIQCRFKYACPVQDAHTKALDSAYARNKRLCRGYAGYAGQTYVLSRENG